MMDLVLERLEVLQAQLAALDPAHELGVAHEVAAIASTLRDVLGGVETASDRTPPAAGVVLRRVG